MEVTVQLRIVGGLELPKTDLMSEIDPFCKVFFNDIEVSHLESWTDDDAGLQPNLTSAHLPYAHI